MATEDRTTDAEPEQEQERELEDLEEQQDQDDQSATTTIEETVPEQYEDEPQEPDPIIATQPIADTTTDDEELLAELEPTFLSMWKELTELHLEDLVRLYREGKRPYMKVYSKQKGNVHIRLDIHRRDRCTDFFSELAAGQAAE